MGFFSKRPKQQDLGTMEGNPSTLDAIEDLPLVAKTDLLVTGGTGLMQEGAEVATTQDIGRDMEDDIDATDAAEEHLFDELGHEGDPADPS